MNPMSLCVAALSFHGLLLPSTSAHAQSFEAVRLQRTAPGQDLAVIGLVALSDRAHAGADERRTMALPRLDCQWASGWLTGVSSGFGIHLSSDPQWQYGLRMTVDLDRREKRTEALRGMGNIDPRLEGGAFLNLVLPSRWQTTTSLRYGSGIGGGGLAGTCLAAGRSDGAQEHLPARPAALLTGVGHQGAASGTGSPAGLQAPRRSF